MTACVFHTVGGDDEDGMLGDIFGARVLMDIADVVDCSSECIQKCGAAVGGIFLLGQRLNLVDVHAVVNDLCCVGKQHGGNIALAVELLLLLNHCVEAADGVGLEPCHRAALVKDKYQFSDVVFHNKSS